MVDYVLTYIDAQTSRRWDARFESKHGAMTQAYTLLVRQYAKLISLKGPDVALQGEELEKAAREYPVND